MFINVNNFITNQDYNAKEYKFQEKDVTTILSGEDNDASFIVNTSSTLYKFIPLGITDNQNYNITHDDVAAPYSTLMCSDYDDFAELNIDNLYLTNPLITKEYFVSPVAQRLVAYSYNPGENFTIGPTRGATPWTLNGEWFERYGTGADNYIFSSWINFSQDYLYHMKFTCCVLSGTLYVGTYYVPSLANPVESYRTDIYEAITMSGEYDIIIPLFVGSQSVIQFAFVTSELFSGAILANSMDISQCWGISKNINADGKVIHPHITVKDNDNEQSSYTKYIYYPKWQPNSTYSPGDRVYINAIDKPKGLWLECINPTQSIAKSWEFKTTLGGWESSSEIDWTLSLHEYGKGTAKIVSAFADASIQIIDFTPSLVINDDSSIFKLKYRIISGYYNSVTVSKQPFRLQLFNSSGVGTRTYDTTYTPSNNEWAEISIDLRSCITTVSTFSRMSILFWDDDYSFEGTRIYEIDSIKILSTDFKSGTDIPIKHSGEIHSTFSDNDIIWKIKGLHCLKGLRQSYYNTNFYFGTLSASQLPAQIYSCFSTVNSHLATLYIHNYCGRTMYPSTSTLCNITFFEDLTEAGAINYWDWDWKGSSNQACTIYSGVGLVVTNATYNSIILSQTIPALAYHKGMTIQYYACIATMSPSLTASFQLVLKNKYSDHWLPLDWPAVGWSNATANWTPRVVYVPYVNPGDVIGLQVKNTISSAIIKNVRLIATATNLRYNNQFENEEIIINKVEDFDKIDNGAGVYITPNEDPGDRLNGHYTYDTYWGNSLQYGNPMTKDCLWPGQTYEASMWVLKVNANYSQLIANFGGTTVNCASQIPTDMTWYHVIARGTVPYTATPSTNMYGNTGRTFAWEYFDPAGADLIISQPKLKRVLDSPWMLSTISWTKSLSFTTFTTLTANGIFWTTSTTSVNITKIYSDRENTRLLVCSPYMKNSDYTTISGQINVYSKWYDLNVYTQEYTQPEGPISVNSIDGTAISGMKYWGTDGAISVNSNILAVSGSYSNGKGDVFVYNKNEPFWEFVLTLSNAEGFNITPTYFGNKFAMDSKGEYFAVKGKHATATVADVYVFHMYQAGASLVACLSQCMTGFSTTINFFDLNYDIKMSDSFDPATGRPIIAVGGQATLSATDRGEIRIFTPTINAPYWYMSQCIGQAAHLSSNINASITGARNIGMTIALATHGRYIAFTEKTQVVWFLRKQYPTLSATFTDAGSANKKILLIGGTYSYPKNIDFIKSENASNLLALVTAERTDNNTAACYLLSNTAGTLGLNDWNLTYTITKAAGTLAPYAIFVDDNLPTFSILYSVSDNATDKTATITRNKIQKELNLTPERQGVFLTKGWASTTLGSKYAYLYIDLKANTYTTISLNFWNNASFASLFTNFNTTGTMDGGTFKSITCTLAPYWQTFTVTIQAVATGRQTWSTIVGGFNYNNDFYVDGIRSSTTVYFRRMDLKFNPCPTISHNYGAGSGSNYNPYFKSTYFGAQGSNPTLANSTVYNQFRIAFQKIGNECVSTYSQFFQYKNYYFFGYNNREQKFGIFRDDSTASYTYATIAAATYSFENDKVYYIGHIYCPSISRGTISINGADILSYVSSTNYFPPQDAWQETTVAFGNQSYRTWSSSEINIKCMEGYVRVYEANNNTSNRFWYKEVNFDYATIGVIY